MTDRLSLLTQRYPVLSAISDDIFNVFELLRSCFDNGGKVLICGNGGSAADAEHIVGELMKGFMLRRELSDEDKQLFDESGLSDPQNFVSRLQGALPAIALSAHNALNTAFSNDVDADMIFAQQVWGYSKDSPDALIALSTSGNSTNVVNAVKTARAIGIDSIGITGQNESALSKLCTVCLCIPETETFKVQELTMPIYHALCAALEEYFFGTEE